MSGYPVNDILRPAAVHVDAFYHVVGRVEGGVDLDV